MITYQQEDRTRGRIIGAIATVIYVLMLVLLLLLVKFSIKEQDEMSNGIMINFGNVDEAAPGADMAMNDQIADAQTQQSRSAAAEDEMLTQEFEEAPAVVEQVKKVKKPADSKTPNPTTKPAVTAPVEKPREVDRRALFPGRTEGSTSKSDGTGTGSGNQGNLAGTPEGSYDGTGTGNSGVGSANLTGRTLAKESLLRPVQARNEEGRVVIVIFVDQLGNVTSAEYTPKGSTTLNILLRTAAERAAKQAKFNVDHNAPITQRGEITYIFKLEQ